MKKITLLDFLTHEEIEHARKLKNAREIKRKIVDPNLRRINAALGQQNDAMYLSYMIEYVVSIAKPRD
jgi:hypothetical protein